jgi:hypothetical protein
VGVRLLPISFWIRMTPLTDAPENRA